MNEIYFIAYDIINEELNRKIQMILKNYNFFWVYRSIFQYIADKRQILMLKNVLDTVVKENSHLVGDGDSIIIIGGLGSDKIGYVLGVDPNQVQYSIY